MKKVEVLWSGGFDSTFMVVNYLMQGYTVKPYYILFDRDWHQREINTLKKLSDVISSCEIISGKLLPFTVVPKSSLKVVKKIENAWEKFKGEPYYAAKQYVYFSFFFFFHSGIAIGQERYYSEPGHTTRLMYEKGHMKFTKDGVGYFNVKDCHPLVYALYGKSVYPVCLLTNRMMMDKFKEWGLEKIAFMTLSCHYPISGEPCGVCDPCITKIRQHMDELFPVSSLNRGFVYNYLEQLHASFHGKGLNYLFRFYVTDREGFSKGKNPHLVDFSADELLLLAKKFDELIVNPIKIYDGRK